MTSRRLRIAQTEEIVACRHRAQADIVAALGALYGLFDGFRGVGPAAVTTGDPELHFKRHVAARRHHFPRQRRVAEIGLLRGHVVANGLVQRIDAVGLLL